LRRRPQADRPRNEAPGVAMTPAAFKLISDLIASVGEDESRGGLLTRATIHKADEVRVLLARERRRRGEAEADVPHMRREERDPL
jgi:hypothetical protein